MAHNLFAFEADEFADLHWMPLAFRFRLDACGLKLTLASWQNLPFSERVLLLNSPFEGEDEQMVWAAHLKNALAVRGLEGPTIMERWIDPGKIPGDVAEKLEEFDCEMSAGGWRDLTPIQRHALCKLARGKQANRYLYRAFLEFRK